MTVGHYDYVDDVGFFGEIVGTLFVHVVEGYDTWLSYLIAYPPEMKTPARRERVDPSVGP